MITRIFKQFVKGKDGPLDISSWWCLYLFRRIQDKYVLFMIQALVTDSNITLSYFTTVLLYTVLYNIS